MEFRCLFPKNQFPVGSLGSHSPTTHRPQSHSLRKMSGQAESPTKALVPNDSLHNDQWKLDLQKSTTVLSAQVNTLQANLNQMSGPALPTLDNNGPISKEPLADDQWILTMHQILAELCAKVNNLESELRDLKSQTCPLLQPPVPAHLLTKVMGRPMPDKTLHEMDDITPTFSNVPQTGSRRHIKQNILQTACHLTHESRQALTHSQNVRSPDDPTYQRSSRTALTFHIDFESG
ncbi:hypothetical protein SARC_11909 [Sphaeroforma arctica JP610]|uniref:Uncharacterized protein n=1 Tax=Sphaeroforma arctica JP610 TaxID=667725 RepID=A0A0L0FFR0_9EUKA|nr:hypothetical protein SARC_11909 [Sphaeroforma arctica JP610]KNC75570.1 hypothetical protein SARC_11909 [Sphaeroforma arctica JP610]|eukprot:XP_014149472.1 hypothetical protein SARC_11909 [Sphaeroforma arctica JP610]